MARPKGLPKTGGRQAGTPNKATCEVRALAQEYTEAAVLVLAEVMTSRDATPAARVSAASALLDRGHGKPSQALTGAGDKDLIPERATDPERAAQALMLLFRDLAAPGEGSEAVVLEARESAVPLVTSVALPGSSPAGVPN